MRILGYLLSSGIPKAETDHAAVNHNVGRVVIKNLLEDHQPYLIARAKRTYCGYVFLREGIRGVCDKQAGFTDSTISINIRRGNLGGRKSGEEAEMQKHKAPLNVPVTNNNKLDGLHVNNNFLRGQKGGV